MDIVEFRVVFIVRVRSPEKYCIYTSPQNLQQPQRIIISTISQTRDAGLDEVSQVKLAHALLTGKEQSNIITYNPVKLIRAAI